MTGAGAGAGTAAEWIAVDWGTTHLRAWAMVGDQPRAEASSADGMGRLERDGFEPALLRLVEPWLAQRKAQGPIQVLACGMVGARQGWREAPYVAVPARPTRLVPVDAEARDPRLLVRIVPGLSQAHPADVMRGEETQIAGFLAQNPGFDGVLCLPGTHAKWVRLSAGEVVSFQTAMTGELFQLLAEASVLRHSIGAEGEDPAAFAEAVSEALARPERLSVRLFGLRAENVLHGLSPHAARARLSGYLIGAELAATRPYWLGQEVAIAGAPHLARTYAEALRMQGASPAVLDAAPLTRAGLSRVHAALTESA